MENIHVAITGPTSGIGRSSSLALARLGARLTLLCRDPGKGELLRQEIVDETGHDANIVQIDIGGTCNRATDICQECITS